MKERELWELTLEALETFYDVSKADPTIAPEDVAEEILAHCLAASPAEASFVRECVVGVTHFESLCDGALQGYCNFYKRNKSDRLSMLLMAYIIYFRYSELGAETVRELFFRCTSTPRIAEYMSFLVDDVAVRDAALPLWITAYDEGFLDRTVFATIARISHDVRSHIVDWLHAKGAGAVAVPVNDTSFSGPSAADPKPPGTVAGAAAGGHGRSRAAAKAPALHAGNGRRLPPAEVREMAQTIPEPRPAPPKASAGSRSGATQQRAKKKPPTEPVGFSFHRTAACPATEAGPSPPPPTTEALIGATARVPRQTPQRLRAILNKDVETRMTNAAILREAHTYRMEEEAEVKALADKEYNPHDTLSYEAWRDEQRQEEAHQRELQIIEHHLDALRSRERVVEQRDEAQRQRQHEQRHAKQKQEKEKARLERERADELKAQRGFVSSLRHELATNRTAAQRSCTEDKMKAADEVRAENERLAQEAEAAQERERVEQALVMEEIRQLRVRIRERQAELRAQRLDGRTKAADGTSFSGAAVVGGGGTSQGMSLEECRQELVRLRAEDAELEAARRARIAEERDRMKQDRRQLEQQLQEERDRRRRARQGGIEKRQGERQALRDAQLKSENERMLELHDRLAQQREARQKEWSKTRNEERQVKNDLLLLAQDHTAVEQKRWLQQEHGATHRIATEQKLRLAEKQQHYI